jgi:hypothetical protein
MTEIGINYILLVLFVCFMIYSAIFWIVYWLTDGTFMFMPNAPIDPLVCTSCKGNNTVVVCPYCNGTGRIDGYFDSR